MASGTRPRSLLRELADGFRIFSAPRLPGLCRRRIPVENPANLLYEILGQARFGDERVAARFLRAFRNTRERVPGQRDDWDPLSALVGFEPAGGFPAVHHR